MHISGGTITDIEPVAFQCPLNRITADPDAVRWQLATAGNDMGFTFSLDGPDDTSLNISTGPCSFVCRRSEFASESKVIPAGGVQRRIEIGPAPSVDTPLSATESFEDNDPHDGEHAYWVRITQTDRHRAWSSPIYVTT